MTVFVTFPTSREPGVVIAFTTYTPEGEADTIPTDSVPTDAIPTICSQDDPVHL